MASIEIEARGLRDVEGHFAAYAMTGLRQELDTLLHELGVRLKDQLAATAPGHLGATFEVSPVKREGDMSRVEITNPRTVTSKAGRTWNLLELIVGGTKPHAIPNSFGFGEWFGDWPDFHPGTKPNPFVEQAVETFNSVPELRNFGIKAATRLTRGEP